MSGVYSSRVLGRSFSGSLLFTRLLDSTSSEWTLTTCFLGHFSQLFLLLLLFFFEGHVVLVQVLALSLWLLQRFSLATLTTGHFLILLDNRNRTQKWDESPC